MHLFIVGDFMTNQIICEISEQKIKENLLKSKALDIENRLQQHNRNRL